MKLVEATLYWTAVTDALPPPCLDVNQSMPVLVHNVYGVPDNSAYGVYDHKYKQWRTNVFSYGEFTQSKADPLVTHWSPIPRTDDLKAQLLMSLDQKFYRDMCGGEPHDEV